MNKTQRNILIGSAVIVALASTAAAMTYFNSEKPEPIKVASVQRPAQQQAAAQPKKQPCDDGNAAGIVLGGAGGALVGNQFGKGSGKTAATLAGAAGGAYLGQEYLPTQGALCK